RGGCRREASYERVSIGQQTHAPLTPATHRVEELTEARSVLVKHRDEPCFGGEDRPEAHRYDGAAVEQLLDHTLVVPHCRLEPAAIGQVAFETFTFVLRDVSGCDDCRQ